MGLRSALSVVAPLAIVVVGVCLSALYSRVPIDAARRRLVIGSTASMVVGAAVWSAVWVVSGADLAPGLAPSAVALAAVAGLVVSLALRERTRALGELLALVAAWVLIGFSPIALALLSNESVATVIGVAPLDHGGAFPALIAPAGAACAAILLRPRRTGDGPRVDRPETSVIVSTGLFVAWGVWLVSLELAFDEVATGIALNTAAAAAAGIAGWLVVQRVAHESTSARAAAAGLVGGLGSITAGAASLAPAWAAVVAFASSALGAAFAHSRVAASGRESWFIVGALGVAPAVGAVLAGLFGSGVGFVFVGQVQLVQDQFLAAVLSFGFGFAVMAAFEGVSIAAHRAVGGVGR